MSGLSVILGSVQRAVLLVAFGLPLLLTGCDQLFKLTHVDSPPPDAPRPTTHLVQQQTASDPKQWTLAATLPDPPTSGNVLVVIGATDRYNLLSPSGGGVSTWMLAAMSGTHANLEIWYGIPDGSSATVTITCACPMTTLGNMRLSVSEWAGLATSNVVEDGKDAAGTATPGAATLPPLTTLDSPDLLIFGVAVVGTAASDATDAAGRGMWTALDSISVDPVVQRQWYQLVAEPNTYTASAMVNGDWDAAIVAFRASP